MISTLTRLPDSDSKMSQWKLNVAHVAHTIFFFKYQALFLHVWRVFGKQGFTSILQTQNKNRTMLW